MKTVCAEPKIPYKHCQKTPWRRSNYLILVQAGKSQSHYVSLMMDECMVITYSKGKDQPGKAGNPARGQLNRGKYHSLVHVRA